MIIDDLISCYSKIISDCEKDLKKYDDDDFSRGYSHGQINTYILIIRDLKELKGNKHD